MTRHWSFIACDPRYLYPLVGLLFTSGIAMAVTFHDATLLNRFGNFIIGTGVWMTMRYTLREGLNKHKTLTDSLPTVPGTGQLNDTYFNNVTFALGDARLQVHGFIVVILGSVVGSFGDLMLKYLCADYFR